MPHKLHRLVATRPSPNGSFKIPPKIGPKILDSFLFLALRPIAHKDRPIHHLPPLRRCCPSHVYPVIFPCDFSPPFREPLGWNSDPSIMNMWRGLWTGVYCQQIQERDATRQPIKRKPAVAEYRSVHLVVGQS